MDSRVEVVILVAILIILLFVFILIYRICNKSKKAARIEPVGMKKNIIEEDGDGNFHGNNPLLLIK